MGYTLNRALNGFLLIVGVTLVSFTLMVWYGPDQTYTLIGKNASAEQIANVRSQLGYDQPFVQRYLVFLKNLATFDLGQSQTTGEPVLRILLRGVPISLMLVLPGFFIGNLLGIALGLFCAPRQGQWMDRLVTGFSVVSMSLSFLVIIILAQLLLSTPYGLDWFPVRGWNVSDPASWFRYAAVPSVTLILVSLGYNTRFYRAVFVEEFNRDHIRTLKAYGVSRNTILWKHVLKNSLVPILTRVIFSIPLIVISGSLLLETYFGVPGIGKETFDAISNGDQPVLMAVVTLSAVAFVVLQVLADLLYRVIDPRTVA